MVVLQLKKNESTVLLATCPVTETNDNAIELLVTLYNSVLRVERLCTAAEDLAAHGVQKPVSEHGYTDEEIKEFADKQDKKATSEQTKVQVIRTHNGIDYISNPDPSGLRCGLAPLDEYATTIRNTVNDAREAISKNKANSGESLTLEKIQKVVDCIRGAVTIAYPMGIPDFDPVHLLLNSNDDVLESVHAREAFESTDCATLWWAGRELLRGRSLAEYIGKNDKTKIVVKLQRKGEGAPMREAPLDEEGRRRLMAYYFKKQELEKKLDAAGDTDDGYLGSTWSDTKALKSRFNGIRDINWRP